MATDMSTPPARKRVTQACVPCGLKKVKCDAQLPICSPCRHRGIECVYGSTKRRSRASMAESPRLRPEAPYGYDAPSIPINGHPAATHLQSAHIQARPLGPPVRDIKVSPEISVRLLHTYFNCIHPLWPLLYKPLYASLNFGSPTDMMSPSLVTAIYAIASCVDRPLQHAANTIIPKYPEPWQFFEGALNLLQGSAGTARVVNALQPSINNCQVLTILALQQHGLAEYSRAAILCGLASAMAIELRLHRPPDTDDAIQSEVHSRLWWNLYILEKMMSCEMGRPVLLRSEETDCPYPSMAEADEFELMSNQMGSQGTSQKKNNSVKLRTISGLHSTINLSILMERITREIYGIAARKTIRDNRVAGEAKRTELWLALQQWEREMEASALKLDLSPELSSVPASVTNYVINWEGTIMLHRPFIARWASNPAASSSPSPHDVCLDAARKICTTLEKYFERLLGLPCDMVFGVFLAASTLLYHSKHSREDEVEIRRQLQLCIRWLSALGKSWKSAGARQKMLADMFDLPPDLRGQQDHATPNQGPANEPLPLSPPNSKHPYGSPAPRISSEGARVDPPEDWTFLHEFGDPTDEFYELDVQLRGLLDGGLDPQQMNFVVGA